MSEWLRELVPGLRGLAVEIVVVIASLVLATAAGLIALAIA